MQLFPPRDVNDAAWSKCEVFLVQTAPLMHSDQTSGGKYATVSSILLLKLWTLSSETDVEVEDVYLVFTELSISKKEKKRTAELAAAEWQRFNLTCLPNVNPPTSNASFIQLYSSLSYCLA